VLFWSGMLRTHQRPPGLAATSLDRYWRWGGLCVMPE
jgi:hypothetical protein